jgi:hypothetical protein
MAFSVITPLACTLAGKKCLFIFLNKAQFATNEQLLETPTSRGRDRDWASRPTQKV